jgi:hypothetical protein
LADGTEATEEKPQDSDRQSLESAAANSRSSATANGTLATRLRTDCPEMLVAAHIRRSYTPIAPAECGQRLGGVLESIAKGLAQRRQKKQRDSGWPSLENSRKRSGSSE